MNKKALSLVIATVLLISLGITLALLIMGFNKNFLSTLSPPTDCEGINFKADLYENNGKIYLDVVNQGTVKISGFQIKSVKQGELKIEEEIERETNPGKTETIDLNSVSNSENKFLIVPVVSRENPDRKTARPCTNQYGLEVELIREENFRRQREISSAGERR
ncbi:MAG: hypothetical protein ABIG28_02660 [archaeon]